MFANSHPLFVTQSQNRTLLYSMMVKTEGFYPGPTLI